MPRTLAQNAQYIAETIKPAIKSAIEAQGVTVPSTDSFLDYADRIGEIEGGGSGYQLKDLPTGSISTVNDAAELPLNALKVSVEAVQDLHGYDHPWGGGAGKNKLLFSVDACKTATRSYTWVGNQTSRNGLTFELQTDEDGNAIGVKVTGTATRETEFGIIYRDINAYTLPSGSYILNGCPSGGSWSTYRMGVNCTRNGSAVSLGTDTGTGATFSINDGEPLGAWITIVSGHAIPSGGLIFKPMIRLSAVADATFEPYSNICPISGWSSATIIDKNDLSIPTTTKTWKHDFTDAQGQPLTVYGAEWDVVGGELKVTDGYIASYNGETLPGIWMSDRDVYQAGTTPTIGAQVKYKLATPTYITLTGLSIRLLQGTNNIYADCGEVIEGEYFVDEGAIDVRKVDYQIGSSGSIKTTGGRVLSGFASMNGYHARPLDASRNWLDVDWSKSFEIGIAFKYTVADTNQTLFGSGIGNANYYKCPMIMLHPASQQFEIDISTTGNSWDMTMSQTVTYASLTINTWYFLKMTFNQNDMSLVIQISDDFSTWDTLLSITMSAAYYHDAASLCFGGFVQNSSFSSNNLLIDTFNTYIKGDGVSWGASTGAFPS